MLTDTSFHRRGNARGLMNSRKVVVNVKNRQRMDMILDLFTEGVRQASEAPVLHSQVKILALHIAGADMLRIWRTKQRFFFDAKTLRGAVRPCSDRIGPENLNQLRVVDIIGKGINHGIQVHLVAVRGELHAIRQASGHVLKEIGRKPRISPTYRPTDNQLRLCFDGNKRPDIASDTLRGDLRRHVLLLAADEAPNLINLNSLGRNVANGCIQVFGARGAHRSQQPKDSAFRDVSHAPCGADRAPFDQRRNHRAFLVHADNVRHESIMPYRFRISKIKMQDGGFLRGFLRFGPPGSSCFSGASAALFIGHSFQSALPADPSALSAHVAHDLLNDGKLHRLSRFDSFQKYAARVLYGIKLWSCACPLWHTPKRCTDQPNGQEAAISNGPTTIH